MAPRRIWEDGDTVFLREEHWSGKDRIRQFYVGYTHPQFGTGYVWERGNGLVNNNNPRGKQVCEGLQHLGNTLTCRPEKLLDLIRRQYRAAKAYERRQEQRYWR